MHTAVIAQEQAASQQDSMRPERDELPLGTCIHGKYTVHGVLGHGGFATVYDAVHLGLQRNVAIKVMHVRSDTPVALIERFHREARISALVRHPNVLEVYDTGALPDGSPYLVMERMNGETLASALTRGTLPIAMVCEIGRQLLSALIAIGDAGVVHRDLKPENIMLDHPIDGPPSIKLVDFGISKQMTVECAPRLTWQGALIGTPQYMSPEQMSGESTDGRTDLYSLGAVLYETLTGRAPHQSESFSELIVAVLNAPIVAPRKLRRNCPSELEQLVLRALARKPDQRFQTPREMLAELEEIVHQLALPRGSEAFGAVDTAETPRPVRPVTARDTNSSASRLWPLLPSARGRLPSNRIYAFGALALAVLGAPYLFGSTDADSLGAKAVTKSAALPAVLGGAGAASRQEPARVARAVPGEAIVEPLAEGALDDSVPVDDSVPLGKLPHAEARVARRVEPALHDEGSKQRALAPKVEELAPRKVATGVATGMAPARAPAAKPEATTVARPQTMDRAWEQAMQSALSELVRGSLETARMRYQEAVKIDGSKPAAFRGLGLVSARLGDARAARAALLRYLELAPNARDAATINARLATLQ